MIGASNGDWRQRMERLQGHLAELERSAPPELRDGLRQLVQTILQFHAAGLARLTELLAQSGEVGQAILQACALDELAGNLLLLHGLHPWDLEKRLRWALNQLRPRLLAEGASAALVSVADGTAVLHLDCPSQVAVEHLHLLIEEVLTAVAPEVERVDIQASENRLALIPLPLVGQEETQR
jgi:hypothetical protein